jgi:NAD(P)-dependent dehydrogenase (short-subunit alcohol dehydrogenase family)
MGTGKTALVTGALGALGNAIVGALVADGFRTVLLEVRLTTFPISLCGHP